MHSYTLDMSDFELYLSCKVRFGPGHIIYLQDMTKHWLHMFMLNKSSPSENKDHKQMNYVMVMVVKIQDENHEWGDANSRVIIEWGTAGHHA